MGTQGAGVPGVAHCLSGFRLPTNTGRDGARCMRFHGNSMPAARLTGGPEARKRARPAARFRRQSCLVTGRRGNRAEACLSDTTMSLSIVLTSGQDGGRGRSRTGGCSSLETVSQSGTASRLPDCGLLRRNLFLIAKTSP